MYMGFSPVYTGYEPGGYWENEVYVPPETTTFKTESWGKAPEDEFVGPPEPKKAGFDWAPLAIITALMLLLAVSEKGGR